MTAVIPAPANLIASRWKPIPGDRLVVRSPARPDRVLFSAGPTVSGVDAAVQAARAALPAWRRLPVERRVAVLTRFAALAKARQNDVADVLCDEVGKVLWEARQEAGLLANKVEITLDTGPEGGRRRVSEYELELTKTRRGRCLFRPHGVMAVLGPFNFPVHLPNGHIVPALLMGNTVVFKPSDKAPASGQLLAALFLEALDAEQIAIPGVVNLVHGGADVARALVAHDGVDGIAFTGSWPVGRAILEANLDRPGRIAALEMGGNNAAVVMPDGDLKQAAIEVARCAFNTAGERCTSTRRLVVHEAVAGRLLGAIRRAAEAMVVGDPRSATPVFYGPLITEAARRAVLDAQAGWARAGAETVLAARAIEVAGCPGGHFVTPGITRVERFVTGGPADAPGADVEVFGPLLRVAVVRSLDEAIEQANATAFGLAASIFTRDPAAIDRFEHEARAGCVNVNTGTAGASSKLPFGGLGLSGNHRPAGSFALDYCAYPVASMVESGDTALVAEGMAFDPAWLG